MTLRDKKPPPYIYSKNPQRVKGGSIDEASGDEQAPIPYWKSMEKLSKSRNFCTAVYKHSDDTYLNGQNDGGKFQTATHCDAIKVMMGSGGF